MTTWPAPVLVKAEIQKAMAEKMKAYDLRYSMAAMRAVREGYNEAIRKHMEEQNGRSTESKGQSATEGSVHHHGA